MSKISLNALTVMLANSMKNKNILVNAICPGWVRTDMGGQGAPKSPEAAALDILNLAEDNIFNGKFIRNGKSINF